MNERTRLEQLMAAEQMSAKQFAQEVGIQAGTISNIMSGRNNPSLEVLQRVLNRFRTVSSDWLILGVGSMYRPNGGQAVEQTLFDVRPEEVKPTTSHTQSASHTQSSSVQEFSAIDKPEEPASATTLPAPIPTPKKVTRIIIYYSDCTYEER